MKELIQTFFLLLLKSQVIPSEVGSGVLKRLLRKLFVVYDGCIIYFPNNLSITQLPTDGKHESKQQKALNDESRNFFRFFTF